MGQALIFCLSFWKPAAGKSLPRGPKRSESIPVSNPSSHGATEKESDDQVRVGGSPRGSKAWSCRVGCWWCCYAVIAQLRQPFLLAGH